MVWLAQEAAASTDAYLVYGVALVAVAIVLLIVEVFVPSGGLIALVAGVAMIASVACFFFYDTTAGLASVLAYLILGPIVGVFGFRVWLNSRIGRSMILGGNEEDPDAGAEAGFISEQRRAERRAALAALIGVEGVTVTSLRPVGTVVIEGRRIDAMAEGGAIGPDTPIVVTAVQDNQIKVRRKD